MMQLTRVVMAAAILVTVTAAPSQQGNEMTDSAALVDNPEMLKMAAELYKEVELRVSSFHSFLLTFL